jgi:hypothetical protein
MSEGSEGVDEIIESLGDWRADTLTRLRELILDADDGIVEEVKWRKKTNPLGVAAWSKGGLICTGEAYKDKVKLTFAKGGALEDPDGLFNQGTGVRRAIDLAEGDELDPTAFQRLVRAAAAT